MDTPASLLNFLPKGFVNLSPALQGFIGLIVILHMAGLVAVGAIHFTTKREAPFKGKLT